MNTRQWSFFFYLNCIAVLTESAPRLFGYIRQIERVETITKNVWKSFLKWRFPWCCRRGCLTSLLFSPAFLRFFSIAKYCAMLGNFPHFFRFPPPLESCFPPPLLPPPVHHFPPILPGFRHLSPSTHVVQQKLDAFIVIMLPWCHWNELAKDYQFSCRKFSLKLPQIWQICWDLCLTNKRHFSANITFSKIEPHGSYVLYLWKSSKTKFFQL